MTVDQELRDDVGEWSWAVVRKLNALVEEIQGLVESVADLRERAQVGRNETRQVSDQLDTTQTDLEKVWRLAEHLEEAVR